MSRQPDPNDSPESPAWWRLPIVWLVIAGPAVVVVAGFVTLAIALAYPDPIVRAPESGSASDQPAVQARNHSATPRR